MAYKMLKIIGLAEIIIFPAALDGRFVDVNTAYFWNEIVF